MKVLLVCSGGMSTSILVDSLEKAAMAKNIKNFSALAIGSNELDEYDLSGFDLLLIAPQIKHKYTSITNDVGNVVPLYLIPPMQYTPIGAPDLIEAIREKIGENDV